MRHSLSVFRNQTFAKLFFATFTSRMGSVVGMTAFMFYMLDRFSEQPVYTTLTEVMYSLPTLFIFFIVGVVADRMDRQKVAYNSDIICALLSLGLMAAILVDSLPLIFAVLFLRSAVSKFFVPAEQALVQGVLSEKDYTVAAGLNQMMTSLFMLFGNAIGIGVYWFIGIQGAVLFDTLSFLISALLIKRCTIDEAVRLPNGSHHIKDLKMGSVLSDFRAGMVYILKHKLLLSLIMGFFIFGIVNGAFTVMPIYMLKYELVPADYERYSVIVGAVFGVSILIGSIVAAGLANKIKLYQCIVAGLLFSGCFIFACAFSGNVWSYIILLGIVAFFLPLINVAIGGWLPSIVDPKLMGRVEGWVSPIMMLSQTLTLGAISIGFPSIISIRGLFMAVGVLILLVAFFYMSTLPRFSREFDLKKPNVTEAKALS